MTSGPRRVRAAFDVAASEGRTALITYHLAGFPTAPDSLAAAEAALSAGSDLLEIGVPFSDPMADGPTIADAGRVALAGGAGLDSARELVAELRARGHDQPIFVMTYLNPLMAAGLEGTVRALHAAGADGLIVPDLPAAADPALERLLAAESMAISFLVAPNTPAPRLETAITRSTGFVYVVPVFGVTGERTRLAESARPLVEAVRRAAAGRAPVAAGFGLSSRDQVAALAPAADGVIVGSALVTALRDGGVDQLARLIGSLAEGTRRAGQG